MSGTEGVPVLLADYTWRQGPSRNPRRKALGGGGGGCGAGRARGLPSLAVSYFEVSDICGKTIRSEVSLASALPHTPCHLISPSKLPMPRFVNLPCLLCEISCQRELDSVHTQEFFLPFPHPQKRSITKGLLPGGRKLPEENSCFIFHLNLGAV